MYRAFMASMQPARVYGMPLRHERFRNYDTAWTNVLPGLVHRCASERLAEELETLLPKQHVVSLCGEPGQGKSYLAANLALVLGEQQDLELYDNFKIPIVLENDLGIFYWNGDRSCLCFDPDASFRSRFLSLRHEPDPFESRWGAIYICDVQPPVTREDIHDPLLAVIAVAAEGTVGHTLYVPEWTKAEWHTLVSSDARWKRFRDYSPDLYRDMLNLLGYNPGCFRKFVYENLDHADCVERLLHAALKQAARLRVFELPWLFTTVAAEPLAGTAGSVFHAKATPRFKSRYLRLRVAQAVAQAPQQAQAVAMLFQGIAKSSPRFELLCQLVLAGLWDVCTLQSEAVESFEHLMYVKDAADVARLVREQGDEGASEPTRAASSISSGSSIYSEGVCLVPSEDSTCCSIPAFVDAVVLKNDKVYVYHIYKQQPLTKDAVDAFAVRRLPRLFQLDHKALRVVVLTPLSTALAPRILEDSADAPVRFVGVPLCITTYQPHDKRARLAKST